MLELLENERLLEEVVHEIATRTKTARRIVRKTGLPQAVGVARQESAAANTTAAAAQTTANDSKARLDAAGIAQNDNVAPLVPSGIAVTVFEHNLSITWTPPAETEYVKKTRVRITPAGGVAFVRTTRDTYYIAAELAPNVVHTVEVQFEDQWGLISPWSTPVNATPAPLIAEQVAASVQVAATQISGLLGNNQIAQITDPAKLAETVYSTAVERGGRGANLLEFDQAEAASWAVGALPQRGYAYQAAAGRTVSVVAHGADQWWQVVSDATTTAETFAGFNLSWENPPLGGDTYIYSGMVKNTGTTATTARVSAQEATDAAGTGLTTKHGNQITVPPDGKIYRVFVRYANDKTRPFKRFTMFVGAGASTLLFNKFQLEEVTADQLGPGRYTVPVINAGALSARLLTAWDLTAVRAVVGNLTVESAKIADAAIVTAKVADAAITAAKILNATITNAEIADATIASAKIVSIVADKIATGTLSAATVNIGASGLIKAGTSTALDAGGITLSPAPSYDTVVAASSAKITGRGDYAGLMFYSNTNTAADGAYRGVILRADGEPAAAGSRTGAVVLHATPSGTINNQAARLELTSIAGTAGRGDCQVYADLTVSGNLLVGGDIGNNRTIQPHATLANTVIAASTATTFSFISWPHGLGTFPTMLQGYKFNTPVEPLPSLDRTVYFWELTTTAVKIFNENTTSRNAIARAFR